jgi:hypothetical protein
MKDDDDVLNYEWDDALQVHTCTYSGKDEAIATLHVHAHIHRILATCTCICTQCHMQPSDTPGVHVHSQQII